MDKLTPKEKAELVWFLKTVQSWNVGGPYGDGDDITDKKGFAAMNRIIEKLRHA